jgi:hypothetical protein
VPIHAFGQRRSVTSVRSIDRASAERYACLVTNAAESLLEQAVLLPVEERALLASGLLASLDADDIDESEVERLWSVETQLAPLNSRRGKRHR